MLIRKCVNIILLNCVFATVAGQNERSSLVFVIDVTASMTPVIDQVKMAANKILQDALNDRESQIEEFILVTFGDPDDLHAPVQLQETWPRCCSELRMKTYNVFAFQQALNLIRVGGGGYCPEYSMAGIKIGLENALPRSVMYVFTDASAKDHENYKTIEYLAQAGGTQINILLITGGQCYHHIKIRWYEMLTKATSGTLFHLSSSNINDFLRKATEVSRSTFIIKKDFETGRHEFNYNSDTKMSEEKITATGSGTDIQVYGSQGSIKTTIVYSDNNTKILNLPNSKPETRKVIVINYDNPTSVKVTAKSEVHFKHGFITRLPRVFADVIIGAKPDPRSYICVQLTSGQIDLTSLLLLDLDNNVLLETLLYTLNELEKSYRTEIVTLPETVFRVAIEGREPGDAPVRRINSSPIDNRPPDQKPKIMNAELTIKNGALYLTCSATGIPRPEVKWHYKAEGSNSFRPLGAVTYETKSQREHKVTLVIPEASRTHVGQYKCQANNKLGDDERLQQLWEKDLYAPKPPSVEISEGDIVQVEYNADVRLSCRVSAYPSTVGVWQAAGETLTSQVEQSLPFDTTSYLTMKSVKVSRNYTCVGSNSLGTVRHTVSVRVNSPLSAAPPARVSVAYGQAARLQCGARAAAAVASDTVWRHEGRRVGAGAEYTVPAAKLADQGLYQCEVSVRGDPARRLAHNTTLTISDLEKPKIMNAELTIKNGALYLTCSATGIPRPEVTWHYKAEGSNSFRPLGAVTNETKSQREHKVTLVIPEASRIHVGQYKCQANNKLGDDERLQQLWEKDLYAPKPPSVEISEGDIVQVEYNADVRLSCRVSAYPSTVGVWQAAGETLTSQVEQSLPFDTTSYLTMKSVKVSRNYTCVGSNSLGTVRHTVSVRVNSPLSAAPPARVSVAYGQAARLQCGARAAAAVASDTVWRHEGRRVGAGAEYTVPAAKLAAQGLYQCEVSVRGDPARRLAHNTTLTISDLEKPKIMNAELTIKNGALYLTCSATGIPRPEVTWHYKAEGSNSFRPLGAVTNETKSQREHKVTLVIPEASRIHVGQYKCQANNKLGDDERLQQLWEKDLYAPKPPSVEISEGDNVQVEYNADVRLSCRVSAYPSTVGVWQAAGETLTSQVEQSLPFDTTSYLTMKSVKVSRNYTCVGSNSLGTVRHTVSVRVNSPLSAAPPARVSVAYGQAARLQCGARAAAAVASDTVWRHEGRRVGAGAEYTVPAAKLADQGLYQCEVSVRGDPARRLAHNTTLTISDLAEPNIKSLTSEIKNRELHLICLTSGTPKPTISWEFKSKPSGKFIKLSPSTKYQISEGELRLPGATSTDTGEYKCEAISELGSSLKTVEVNVPVAPKITNSIKSFVGVEGDYSLVVPCNVTGLPVPTVEWMVDGAVIRDNYKYSINNANSLIINISNDKKTDKKQYTCVARNDLGEVRETFTTLVDEFNFSGDIKKTYRIFEDTSFTINCLEPHSNSNSTRWYKDNELEDNVRGNKYVINHADSTNEANYTCRVSTMDEGSFSETYEVYVDKLPTFTDGVTFKLINNLDDDGQQLDCLVDSKPKVKITWYRNGLELPNHNYTLFVDDFGSYACKATNMYGTIEKKFEVTGKDCTIFKSKSYSSTMPLMDYNNLKIKTGDDVKLQCGTQMNKDNTFVTHPEATEIIAKCLEANKFVVNSVTYKFTDLQCRNEVKVMPMVNETLCLGKNSELIEIGFGENDAEYSVCYDKKNRRPHYAFTDMSGYGNGYNVNESWTKSEYGNFNLVNKCDDSNKCCYKRGQLVNALDVDFGPSQRATFMEGLNSIAVWQPCAGEKRVSWQNIENEIRATAGFYAKVRVWSGASQYEVQANGTIPRYLWKVLYFEKGLAAAVVYVNHPSPTDEDIICPPHSWKDYSLFETITDKNDKYTSICFLKDFSGAFGIPLTTFPEVFKGKEED